MTEKMFPSPTVMPPLAHRVHGMPSRCMGGCGAGTEKGRHTCDTCWLHLDDRLRSQLRRWSRLNAHLRSTVIVEVEAVCKRRRGQVR